MCSIIKLCDQLQFPIVVLLTRKFAAVCMVANSCEDMTKVSSRNRKVFQLYVQGWYDYNAQTKPIQESTIDLAPSNDYITSYGSLK